ncbi:VanZ family protein [Granulosicoccaceae sp. 1_MG-2023]|nr:VanZ family protein [Granulosicoccaceae sp. 1_MG-2023]
MAHAKIWFSVAHLKWARLWLLLGALLVCLIFYLSLTSSGLPVPRFSNADKVFHLLAYGALMGWFVQIFHHHKGRLLIASMFVLMGVAIEFLQAMHPMRHFDVLDMLANFTGVMLALLAGMTWLDSILVRLERLWLALFGNAGEYAG